MDIGRNVPNLTLKSINTNPPVLAQQLRLRRQRLLQRACYSRRATVLHRHPSARSSHPARTLLSQRIDGWISYFGEHGSSRKLATGSVGQVKDVLGTLEERGYVNQVVGKRDDLKRILNTEKTGVYLGLDPTAPSLHVGHLLPLMALHWLQRAGHRTFTILGGFTATIGDPTGRTAARAPLSDSEVESNLEKIHTQVRDMSLRVMERSAHEEHGSEDGQSAGEVLNNTTWLEHFSRRVQKKLDANVNMGELLGRHTVKTRLENGDPISYLEFGYSMEQAYDWWHLFSTKAVRIQIGGADQFGNILTGAEVVNNTLRQTDSQKPPLSNPKAEAQGRVVGLTVPLLTASSGEKFGKSAGNAVWLDGSMTSPFKLYEFLLGTADADVHRYLKLFTFEALEDLQSLMTRHDEDKSKRLAQHCLARNIVQMVHGTEIVNQTEEAHATYFQPRTSLNVESLRKMSHEAEPNTSATIELPRSLLQDQSLGAIFCYAGLAKSKSEGQRLINGGGAYLGIVDAERRISFKSIVNWDTGDLPKYLIDGSLLLIRAGKQKVKLVKVTI